MRFEKPLTWGRRKGGWGSASEIFPFSQLPENTGSSVSVDHQLLSGCLSLGQPSFWFSWSLSLLWSKCRCGWGVTELPVTPLTWCLSQLRATIAKYHRLGGLYNRDFFFLFLMFCRLRSPTSRCWLSFPGEGSLVGLQVDGFSLCPHKEKVISFSSY